MFNFQLYCRKSNAVREVPRRTLQAISLETIMSEKSFAVVSVSAALVCGVFFYPDPPARPVVSAVPVPQLPVTSNVAVPPSKALVKTSLSNDAAAFLPSKDHRVPLAAH
jgi:hypothetical protein